MKILQDAVESYFDATKGKRPSCFTAKEFKSWIIHEDLAHTKPRKFPCRDCTAQYQSEMREAGKCHIGSIPVSKIIR